MMPHAKRLSPFVTSAVAVLWAAIAMSPLAADHPTANVQVGSPLLLAAKEVFIKGGCPYNLDKICIRDGRGRLVRCHCAS